LRINSAQLYITQSRCPTPAADAIDQYKEILATRKNAAGEPIKVVEYVAASEEHKVSHIKQTTKRFSYPPNTSKEYNAQLKEAYMNHYEWCSRTWPNTPLMRSFVEREYTRIQQQLDALYIGA